jgi:hypothetical protein
MSRAFRLHYLGAGILAIAAKTKGCLQRAKRWPYNA